MMNRCFLSGATKLHFKALTQTLITRTIHRDVSPANNCREIEIKVPWGKVAGKWWGNENQQPILALHGWQDNAGSFDHLAPLLIKNASVLAIDLPGHGLSSWLPEGMIYHEIFYLLLIQRLKNYFKWEKVKILAHSWSAQISFWHTSVFPNDTQFVITLDMLKFPSQTAARFNDMFSQAVSMYYKLEEKEYKESKYTESDLINRMSNAGYFYMDEMTCKTLMIRGTRRTDDGKYKINRDPKLKVFPNVAMFTHDYLLQMANLITCPYLYLNAKESPHIEDEKYITDAFEILKKNNKDSLRVDVPGLHHFHITNADSVAKVINPFLEKHNVS